MVDPVLRSGRRLSLSLARVRAVHQPVVSTARTVAGHHRRTAAPANSPTSPSDPARAGRRRRRRPRNAPAGRLHVRAAPAPTSMASSTKRERRGDPPVSFYLPGRQALAGSIPGHSTRNVTGRSSGPVSTCGFSRRLCSCALPARRFGSSIDRRIPGWSSPTRTTSVACWRRHGFRRSGDRRGAVGSRAAAAGGFQHRAEPGERRRLSVFHSFVVAARPHAAVSDRGSTIETVAYFGSIKELDPELATPAWVETLRARV